MKKNVTGTGSTLVALVFSVLCLTIFTLISLSAANIDKSLADAEARSVKRYYEADLLAECILAEMLEEDTIPGTLRGIDILSEGGKASFVCPISDNKELYVEIAVFEDSYEILDWRMQDTIEWEADSGLPVWTGEPE